MPKVVMQLCLTNLYFQKRKIFIII